MARDELIEWIIMILCVLLWFPRIFFGFNPLWYHLLIYYVEPVALVVIFVRRYRRMKAGFEYSEKVARSQIPGRPDSTDSEPNK
jgi:hypothetical protein